MRHKIKLITLLVTLILISSGCSARYEATITNSDIKEIISVSEDSKKAYQAAYMYKKGNLENFYSSFDYLNDYKNYKVKKYVDKFYLNKDNYERDNYVYQSSGSPTYHYILNNYKKELSLKNNLFINNLVKDSLIVNDNNIILHLDNIPVGLLDEVDDVTISIYTELTVTSNNADSVENNTYTWNLDKNNYLNKKISLYIERPQAEKNPEDDKKNNNTSNKKDNTAFHIIFIIGLYLVIIIAVVNFFNKKKKLF